MSYPEAGERLIMVVATQFSGRSSSTPQENAFVLWFEEVGIADIPLVGGKNASLGEMIQQLTPKGVNVPTGFATMAHAFRYFVERSRKNATATVGRMLQCAPVPLPKTCPMPALPDNRKPIR
jgi:hypothetical protein